MGTKEFFTWLKQANVRSEFSGFSVFDFSATRLGNSDMFNSSISYDDNGESLKQFSLSLESSDGCPMITSVDKSDGTVYINMDTYVGRKYFIDIILQKFGIFRNISTVILYYSDYTVFSSKVFVRKRVIGDHSSPVRNFKLIIRLSSIPDEYGEIVFKPLDISNKCKPWDIYDDKDMFEYAIASDEYGKAVANYVLGNTIDDNEPVCKGKNTSTMRKYLFDNPAEFVADFWLKTGSGWKQASEIEEGDRLLMMGTPKNSLKYLKVETVNTRKYPYGLDVFRFNSSKLNTELPVGFKSDFLISGKPACVSVITSSRNLAIRNTYSTDVKLSDVASMTLKNKAEVINVIAGIFVMCGRFVGNNTTLIELVFNKDNDISEIKDLLTLGEFEYDVNVVNGSTVVRVASKKLRNALVRICSCFNSGSIRSFLIDSSYNVNRSKCLILKGMCMYSNVDSVFGYFKSNSNTAIELVQELILSIEKKLLQIEKSGGNYVLKYIDGVVKDDIIEDFEYGTTIYKGETYSFVVENSKYYFVLARDRNGKVFWVGI